MKKIILRQDDDEETGENINEMADNIDDKYDEGSSVLLLFIASIVAVSIATVAPMLNITVDGYGAFGALRDHQLYFWWPVLFTYLAQMLLGNNYDIKEMFSVAAEWTMVGPFFLNWVDIIASWWANRGGAAGEVMYWIFFLIHVAWTFTVGIFQLMLLPKVLDWAESNETLEELQDDEDAFEGDELLFADF